MSHKDAPPETAEQRRMALFYTARGVSCGWGRDKGGGYLAPYARDAWAAWQEAKRDPRAPDWFPSVTDQPAAVQEYPCACPPSACAAQDGGSWPGEKCRRTADQQPTGAGGNARAFVCCEGIEKHAIGCTADQQSVRADLEQIAEKYKQALDGLSMQDAPQPVEGTGKQSMQACTKNDAGLVQPDDDADPTPWCNQCGARKQAQCKCGPIADNE
jgi:hypothetical protein